MDELAAWFMATAAAAVVAIAAVETIAHRYNQNPSLIGFVACGVVTVIALTGWCAEQIHWSFDLAAMVVSNLANLGLAARAYLQTPSPRKFLVVLLAAFIALGFAILLSTQAFG